VTEASALANQLDRLSHAAVLVVGDVMLDRYLYGAVDRISPEAPIPVLRSDREEAMLGGAGNVLRNLTALGAGATLVTVVGDDGAGAEIAALLEAEPRAGSRLLTVPGRRTTTKVRYIAAGQQLLHEFGQRRSQLAHLRKPLNTSQQQLFNHDALGKRQGYVAGCLLKKICVRILVSVSFSGIKKHKSQALLPHDQG